MCKSVINAIKFAGGGGNVATGVLQIAGGVALDATLRAVEDQNGTDSILNLSTGKITIGTGGNNSSYTDGVSFSPNSSNNYLSLFNTSNGTTPLLLGYEAAGNVAFFRSQYFGIGSTTSGWAFGLNLSTITQNGAVTIKGGGGNILSGRNSSNVETTYITNGGLLYTLNFEANNGGVYRWQGRSSLASSSDGTITLFNNALSSFTRLNFGGTAASNAAIQVDGSTLTTQYADGTSGYCGFAAGEGTRKGISVSKGGTNTPYLGFYNATEIAQPTTSIAEAAYVSGGGGTNVKTDDTFGGYTIAKMAKALLDLGLLS